MTRVHHLLIIQTFVVPHELLGGFFGVEPLEISSTLLMLVCVFVTCIFFKCLDFFSDAMDVDSDIPLDSNGKVLLYTSGDKEALPAMSIKCKTTSNLPFILNEVAERFSPIRSK